MLKVVAEAAGGAPDTALSIIDVESQRRLDTTLLGICIGRVLLDVKLYGALIQLHETALRDGSDHPIWICFVGCVLIMSDR